MATLAEEVMSSEEVIQNSGSLEAPPVWDDETALRLVSVQQPVPWNKVHCTKIKSII